MFSPKELSVKRATDAFELYKTRAIKMGWAFDLTIEDFKGAEGKACSYCLVKVSMLGFDRVNNDNGYTQDNVVGCCGICNQFKATFSKEEFLNHCRLVALMNPGSVDYNLESSMRGKYSKTKCDVFLARQQAQAEEAIPNMPSNKAKIDKAKKERATVVTA